jgi:6-phosphofructokinase 1
VILIPEIPFRYEAVLAKVQERVDRGMLFSIVVVSEGAKPVEGGQVFSRAGDEIYVPRLGGIGQIIRNTLEQRDSKRVTVLGVQRGSTPTPFDPGSDRYGAAVRLAAEGKFDRMVSLHAGKIVDVSIEEAIAVPKRVDINHDAVITARGMSISFGDEWPLPPYGQSG